MAIDFLDCVWQHLRHLQAPGKVRLHMREAQVKVTEAKQAALLFLAGAAAVTFGPGTLGSSPGSSHHLHPIV